MKRDPLEKLLYLIEKEIDLFDKRPTKERKNHPSSECYMNDIIAHVEKYWDLKKK